MSTASFPRRRSPSSNPCHASNRKYFPTPLMQSAPHSRAPARFLELKIYDFTTFVMREFRDYLKSEKPYRKQLQFPDIEVGRVSNAIRTFDKRATNIPTGDGHVSIAHNPRHL